MVAPQQSLTPLQYDGAKIKINCKVNTELLIKICKQISVRYNGKEIDRMNGLNENDYGGRWYDAAVGRWPTVDPLAEKFPSISPYEYCLNNPMRFIDKNGKLPRDIFKSPQYAAPLSSRYVEEM